MMLPPLTLWDVSLWLASAAITLLAAAEVLPSHFGATNTRLSRKRLMNCAIAVSAGFVATVVIKAIELLTAR